MACMGDEATTAFWFNVNSNFDIICYANLLGLASSLSLNSPSKAFAKIVAQWFDSAWLSDITQVRA